MGKDGSQIRDVGATANRVVRCRILTITESLLDSMAVSSALHESLRHTRSLDPYQSSFLSGSASSILDTLLRDTDVMSIAHGLELPLPPVDRQLADKLLSTPGAWKLDSNVPKPVMVRSKGSPSVGTLVAREFASWSGSAFAKY